MNEIEKQLEELQDLFNQDYEVLIKWNKKKPKIKKIYLP